MFLYYLFLLNYVEVQRNLIGSVFLSNKKRLSDNGIYIKIKEDIVVREALFKVPNTITKEHVIKKMNYFDDKAQRIRDIFENDTSIGRDLARELRKELEVEYKNNNLNRTQEYYGKYNFFRTYKAAVQDAFVSVIGQLDKGAKTRSFLYDVQDYMTYYEHDFK